MRLAITLALIAGSGCSLPFLEGAVIGAGSAVEAAQTLGTRMGGGPFFDAAVAQEVAVVFQEFFLAGAGYVGEFDLGFLLEIHHPGRNHVFFSGKKCDHFG